MKTQNELVVISLTHWDREWRFPFEKTRMLLVEMMDGLLDLLDRDPDYVCFHLDGQTILLDDYTEVRPENRDKIARHVENGRLIIGPWYCLPDANQLMGESLARNFLWGERTGRRYGGNMNVGYSPTSWGQVSQMPQILQGFGIPSVIFYRGITADQVPGHYYLWEGPDGSSVFGMRLGDFARSSFFHLVDRPVVYNRGRRDQTHEWSRGGKPFRLAGSDSIAPYEFYEPPMGWFPERIEAAFRDLEQTDLGQWETPFAPAFECNDCTGPFPDTPRIVREINTRIEDDRKVVQGSLPDFVARAMKHLDPASLPRIKGELRHPLRAGVWTDLYAGIQGHRMPLKYAHRRAEFLLQRVAEPFSALVWTLGLPYPRFHLDACWHKLLASQAHDSIGGCGADDVAHDVMERFRQIRIVGDQLVAKACRELAGRIDTQALDKNEIVLVVFNPLPRPRSVVVTAEADTEKSRAVRGFKVLDCEGREVAAQILGKEETLATFNHPCELPLRTRCDHWTFLFQAESVPALGYKVYRLAPAPGDMRHPGSLRIRPMVMENEHLRVAINPNGTFDVHDRATGEDYPGLGGFEDYADTGDHWVIDRPARNDVLYSTGLQADIRVVEDGPLSAAFEARLVMNIPESVTADRSRRTDQTRPVTLVTRIRLVKGERRVRLRVAIDNVCECHVLRMLFPSRVQTDVVHAEMPCDVVERAIRLPDCRDWREPYEGCQVQQTMLDISDGRRGLAILNKGLTQYEAFDNEERTLAITLLRAVTNWNSVRLAYYPDQPGTQLIGTHVFELAVMPHAGDWQEGGCLAAAQDYNVDPLCGSAGAGPGRLPTELSLCELSDPRLVLMALKQGEWDETALVARIHNPGSETVSSALALYAGIAKAEIVNMKETDTVETLNVEDGHRVRFSIGPHRILTLRIVPDPVRKGSFRTDVISEKVQ